MLSTQISRKSSLERNFFPPTSDLCWCEGVLAAPLMGSSLWSQKELHKTWSTTEENKFWVSLAGSWPSRCLSQEPELRCSWQELWLPSPLFQAVDECEEEKLCHPGVLTPMSFIYFPLTREKEAMNGSAAEIWNFNLATNSTQLNSKAKKGIPWLLQPQVLSGTSLCVCVCVCCCWKLPLCRDSYQKGDQGCLQVLLLKLLSFRTIYQHFHTIFQPLSSAALCNVNPSKPSPDKI